MRTFMDVRSIAIMLAGEVLLFQTETEWEMEVISEPSLS